MRRVNLLLRGDVSFDRDNRKDCRSASSPVQAHIVNCPAVHADCCDAFGRKLSTGAQPFFDALDK